ISVITTAIRYVGLLEPRQFQIRWILGMYTWSLCFDTAIGNSQSDAAAPNASVARARKNPRRRRAGAPTTSANGMHATPDSGTTRKNGRRRSVERMAHA